MTETLGYGYSSESTQRDLSNEYQHDRVWMIFKKPCVLVLWMKVASALERLINPFMAKDLLNFTSVVRTCHTFENNYRIKHKFAKCLKEC